MLFRIALLILLLSVPGVTDVFSYPPPIPSHHIRLEFDLKAHTIKGEDRLRIYKGRDGALDASIHKAIEITSIKGAGDQELQYSVKEESKDQKKRVVISLPSSHPSSKKGEVELKIEYHASFKELPGDVKFSREFIDDKPVAYVGEEIILLDASSCWHLCIEEAAAFNVTAVTPSGYEVVMEGTRLSRKEEKGMTVTTWDFPHPASGAYLVGGRYTVTEDQYKDIALYTYLFPEDVSLSDTYIEYSKKYLELYERLLGKYPFRKFAVVENILPTGFGMPSYTLLGQSVLRLPFIVKTSLGHEIAHNWWGNSVYPDYESGNWSEGLTTYLADHLYEEMEGRGAVYRNQILRDYTSYVEPSEEYPLTKFKNRIGPEDRAIGYGKGAYIFHMLRIMLGDEIFYDGLRYVITHRSFKLTSWKDFRTAFEKVSGRELGWFFRQWVEEAGAPAINLGDVRVQEHNGVYILKAEILQKERAYKLYLPIWVETDEGALLTYHWINDPANTLEIEVSSKPRSITIDPSYDLFRRLSPEEVPPTIGKFMGAPNRLIVLPTKGDQERLGSYFKIASEMEDAAVKTDRDVTEEDLKKNSVYLLGGVGENDLAEKLLSKLPPDIKISEETISVKGKEYRKKDSVLIAAMANPYNPGATLLLFSGDTPEYIASVGSRLLHYGKYSYLLFVKGENAEKGIWEGGKLEKKFQIIQLE